MAAPNSEGIALLTGPWQAEPWLDAFRRRAGRRPVALAAPGANPWARYGAVWKPAPDTLASLTDVDVLFSMGAGVDFLFGRADLPAAPIVRFVDPDLTMRMTEWVVLQVLSHHRRQRAYDRQQVARLWRPLPQPAAASVHVGVMGLGALGRDAAQACARLSFPVAGWSRRPQALPELATFHGPAQLDAFLARTDILVVLLPLTPETRGIIDRSLLSKLRRGPLGGAVLINGGRGGLQVEADIIAALDDGTLAGASLDVFESEPLPAASPLWARPDIVVTPHVAADSDPSAVAGFILDQIEAFEAGRPLRHVVDRQAGY
jgi:glyoxylate/hydroxypyruvate reductase A